MNSKVWTQQEREAAAARLYFKKFGEQVPDKASLSAWARDTNSDQSRSIDTECELSEAVELLRLAAFAGSPMLSERIDWMDMRREWLVRNMPNKEELNG